MFCANSSANLPWFRADRPAVGLTVRCARRQINGFARPQREIIAGAVRLIAPVA
jgi:hypothetical protein